MADSQRKTANLFDGVIEQGSYDTSVTPVSKIEIQQRCRASSFIDVSGNFNYTASLLGANDDIQCVIHFLNGSKGKISEVGWSTAPISFTTPNGCQYIDLIFKNTSGTAISPVNCGLLMVNEGSTAKPYEPYGWLHSLRKLTTATEAVENPLYSDGTAITAYNIKGNEEHTGTPTPSNPVEVNGVGVRTENLLDESKVTPNTYIGGSGETGSSTASNLTDYIDINASPFVISGVITGSIRSANNRAVCFYDSNKNFISSVSYSPNVMTSPALISDVPQNAKYIRFAFDKAFENGIMLNLGATALPYEPYGYKIPISSGGVTTNIYLGSTQTVRQIKKLVLTGNENISNATQLTVGYRFSINIPTGKLSSAQKSSICTHFVYKTDWNNLGFTFGNADNQLFIMADISGVNDTTTFANWLAIQYAAGTPVTVWYVLATAETAAVNEPLMKIGDYADTLSNATSIPTTEGANSITVDTTVQPSEFTATWTGWHDASVKEKSENLFDERIEGAYISSGGAIESNDVYDVAIIPVIAGEQYAFAYKQDYTQNYVIAYYTTKPVVGSTSYDSSRIVYYYSDTPQVTITVPTGVTYIAIRLPLNGDLMFNTGSTALPYEQYWK